MAEQAFKPVNLSVETYSRLQTNAANLRQSMHAHVAWLLDQEDASVFMVMPADSNRVQQQAQPQPITTPA